MNAHGKKFLKITGILFIIFSGIALLAALFGNEIMAEVAEETGVSRTFIIIESLLMLAAGVMGVLYCEAISKANILMGIGIAILTWDIISIINMSFDWTAVIALPLPILYLIGAVKNKKSEVIK